MRLDISKYFFFILVLFFICIAVTRCQDDDEEDEDTYDEEGESESTTTTRRYRVRSSTVASALSSGSTETVTQSAGTGISTEKSATADPLAATSSAAEATSAPAAAAPAVTQAAPVTVRTSRPTTTSDYDDEDPTTTEEPEEEGYAYIFRPLNNLVDNIVAGNVTGIVDNALSIRTPPEIRAFVNNVMSNVFGSGIGSALKQFMPNIFSTRAPPTSSPGRDPIPTQVIKKSVPEPLAAVVQGFEGRTNDTEGNSTAEKKPMEISFAGHPGSPASRLKCEIVS